jgi:O-antigen ligase
MELALKVLAAFFTSAALLLVVSLGTLVSGGIVPQFSRLAAEPREALVTGLMLGYALLLVAVYAGCAWLIWRRRRWNLALLLSVLACFGFPVGPLLGIASIILLTRPAARRTFTD